MSPVAIRYPGFIILLFSCIITKAQSHYFKHYQVENGLSNNTVFCSAQDSKGFIWLGTKDGLNRFDGYQFKIFRIGNNNKQSNTDYIYSLMAAENGSLWVGAMSGLYRFNAKKERLEHFVSAVNYVSDILQDGDDRLWLVADSKLCLYNLASRKLKIFEPDRYFNATSVCRANDGNIWVADTRGHIHRYDAVKQTFTSYDLFAHSPVASTRRIEKISPGSGNSLYIGTQSQGIKQFNTDDFSYEDILTYGLQKRALFVRDILQTKADECWFATESGIYILNTRDRSFVNLRKDFVNPYSINDNATYTLLKDNEGSIWVGTYFGGVNYYAAYNTAFKKYFPNNKSSSISGNVVGEICEDQYGNLWVATEDNGVNKIDKATGKVTQFLSSDKKGSISYSNIHGLAAIGNDLWIGTYQHGIDVMDIRTGKVKKHYTSGTGKGAIESNFAYRFLYTRSHQLYIGTTAGVFYYNKTEDSFEKIPIMSENIYGKPMIEDHSGRIWVGAGTDGIYWFDPATDEKGRLLCNAPGSNALCNKIINDIYEDSDHNLWIATEGGGLCRLNDTRTSYKWYNVQTGFPASFIFKILEDNHQQLWISSSKGIICLDPVTGKTRVYRQTNGLLSDQFNRHSGYRDENGQLYFGSSKGLISFDPASLGRSTAMPPVYITGFQVFDKELTVDQDSVVLPQSLIYTGKIILSHRQSAVSIDFAALSFVSPEMTPYSYRLMGLSDEWTTIPTNRKVYFTNLTPGTYTFEVKAGSNHSGNNNRLRRLTIIVKPPVWLTNWAICLYVLIGIGMVYLLLRNYHKRQQNKKEKEIYRSKIDFFTNVAHEIRTPLTLIKGPIESLREREHEYEWYEIKEDIDCLDRNANRLMALASQILDFRQIEINSYQLDFETVNINETLSEVFLSFNMLAKKSNLEYELLLPDEQVRIMADKDALQKIFSNLISNAIKYADRYIHISMSTGTGKSGKLQIEFENDGFIIPADKKDRIFDPFYRIKEHHHQKGTGIGLTLAKSLATLHKGELYLSFSRTEANAFILVLPLQADISDEKGRQ